MSASNFCFLAYRSEVSFRSLACSSRSIVSVDTSILSPFEKINPLEAINTPKGKSGNLQYIAMTIDTLNWGLTDNNDTDVKFTTQYAVA